MKRSLQEVIELVVFGLIALLIGTGILWLLGWLLGIVSVVFTFLAGIIWGLLRFIIPVALVAGVLFFIYKLFTREKPTPITTSAAATPLSETPTEVVETPTPQAHEVSSEATTYPEESKN
jgi:predicted lipid-binding transport protein (Tim44 family)